jgi:hypothetical protein
MEHYRYWVVALLRELSCFVIVLAGEERRFEEVGQV